MIDEDDLRVVDGWRDVYDFLYEDAWGDEVGEDFTGWDSVYDGAPIPVAEMREWRMATVDRVLALRPRRVLEIGVGDGHILAKVAPFVERYVGTDLSAVAVDSFRDQLMRHPELAVRVELHPLAAHETTRLGERFDTVVINSVVQYFPGLDYLRAVLKAALALLTPGGSVYVGDVRNARTARILASAVLRRRSPVGIPAAELRAEVAEYLKADRELPVDPGWFAGLGPADVRLRRGYAHNELTRHRYDAVLRHTPAAVLSLADAPQYRWDGDFDALGRHLAGARADRVRVVGVPNARLVTDIAADRAIHGGAGPAPATPPADPERFHELAAATGHRAAVTWAPGDPAVLDVVFVAAGISPAAWTDVLRSDT